MFECKICNQHINLDSSNFFKNHVARLHQSTSKEYYDMFYKKAGEGVCIACGKNTSFNCFSRGYYNYCCKKCMNSSQIRSQNRLKSYNARSDEEKKTSKIKRKRTCLEKYGDENYQCYGSPSLKKKRSINEKETADLRTQIETDTTGNKRT